MTNLQQAAQDIVKRWDSPGWKDVMPTAGYIAELRKALDAEITQSVEPVAWIVYVAEVQNQYVVDDIDDAQLVDDCTNHGAEVTPLYLHPPQPQSTTSAVPEGYILVPIEPTPEIIQALQKSLERIDSDRNIYQSIISATKGANQ